jgi:UPF0755 protein
MAKSKGGILKKIIFISVFATLTFAGYWAYENVFKSNVHLNGKKFTYIYIKTGATLNDVFDELYAENIINDHESFEWTARKMKLQDNINPGKYRIDASMSNRSIIKMIINAKQEKVKLFFNSQIRTKEQFINYIVEKLEINQSELEEYCNNENELQENYRLSNNNFMCLIIPESYELNWNTNLETLFTNLKKTYDEVWTSARKAKANAIGYSVSEAIASITQSESNIKTEQQKIAGVYINRLKKDMKLQADPTIVFANGNFDVHRVLSADKEIDSPYNTYMYKGLPPGPICLVKTSVIDAVLNYTKSNYLFFCANADFSGNSKFTDDYAVHQKNAKAYQEALNKKGIKR